MISLRTDYIGRIKQLDKAWARATSKLSPPLSYPDTLGFKPLRELIAEEHGVEANQILITNSATEAIHLLAASLQIFIPPNSFFGALRQPNSIQRQADAIYVNSIQHSTTATTLSLEKLYEIKEGWPVTVFDNPYILLATKALRKIHHGTYTIGSFSKIFGPGLRTGYIIAREENIQALKSAHISMSLSASLPAQELVYHMWNSLDIIRDIRHTQLKEGTKWLRNLGFNTPEPVAGLHTSIQLESTAIPEEVQPYIQVPRGQATTKVSIPINISSQKRERLKKSLKILAKHLL